MRAATAACGFMLTVGGLAVDAVAQPSGAPPPPAAPAAPGTEPTASPAPPDADPSAPPTEPPEERWFSVRSGDAGPPVPETPPAGATEGVAPPNAIAPQASAPVAAAAVALAPPTRPSSAAADQGPTAPPSEGINAELVAGVATTLTGVGTSVALVVMALRMNQLNGDTGFALYRHGVPTDESACDRARAGVEIPGAATAGSVAALCDEGDTLEVLTATALPLSAALLAFGTYLIIDSRTARGRKQNAWVLPTLGPGTAGLVAGYHF